MEEKIRIIVDEFEKFATFNKEAKPVLSARQGQFGKKDSYKLNQMLGYKKNIQAPNYTMDQYILIDLLFSLALDGRLYVRASNETGKPALVETGVMKSFRTLNQHEKYIYFLQTYWTKYHFDEKFSQWFSVSSFYYFLDLIAQADNGQKITKHAHPSIYRLYCKDAALLHHLKFFGLGELEEIEGAKGKYEDSIETFIPNDFGIQLSGFLLTEAAMLWSCKDLFLFLSKETRHESEFTENPFAVFKAVFPDGIVQRTVDSDVEFDRYGVYTFKVSLSKNCWRKINVSHRHSLHDLHMAIQEAFDFGNDHLYAFYIGGNRRTGKPIYCSNAETDEPTADETKIEDMGLYKGQKLYYLFDFGDEWNFDVVLLQIDKHSPLPVKPVIVESKGESPKQYNYWQ